MMHEINEKKKKLPVQKNLRGNLDFETYTVEAVKSPSCIISDHGEFGSNVSDEQLGFVHCSCPQ